MKLDESLIRRHKKLHYIGAAVGMLGGIGSLVLGVIEHDWKLVLASFPFIIAMILVVLLVRSV